MAVTATRPDQVVGVGVGGRPGLRGGNGFHKNGGGKNGGDFRFSPARYRIGGWVAIVSSCTIEIARRSLRQQRDQVYGRWLTNTVVLGIGFVVSQLVAWRQLVKQGVYLAGNPYSSFFYLFTAAHGVHLLGGLLALAFLLVRTRQKRETVEAELRRVGSADAVSLYWHFMDVLWIALFLLLMLWR